mgnify:CR=1 FL=1
MPAKAPEMTVKQLEAIKPPKTSPDIRKAVGGASGLFINVKPSGSKSWLFRYSFDGKRQTPIALGGYSRDTNSLSAMREVARGFNKQIKEGIDPKLHLREKRQEQLRKKAQGISFKEAAEEWIQHKTNGDWKTAKSVQRGRQYITDYAIPVLGHKAVIDIQVEDIVKVLKPDWETKTPTMTRLMGYLEAVIARGLHSAKATNQVNPAVWKNNLDFYLKSPDDVHKEERQPSVAYEEMPQFMKALYQLDKPKGSRPDVQCLALLILCGTRSSATTLMEWDEVDLEKKIWTIPSTSDEKKKRKSKELSWQIPLSPEALRIIKAQPKRKNTKRVFSTLAGGEIYDLAAIPRSLGYEGVAHGFRRTLQNWAKANGYSFEERDLALQHKKTRGVEAAYDTETLLPQRTKLMNAYMKYVMSEVRAK